MARKSKSVEEIASAAAERARKRKAEEMRVRRAYMSLYGAVPPKHKHKKIISLDRIANPPQTKRTRNANGVLVSKRGPKPKPLTPYAVGKHLKAKHRANFVESKSYYRQTQPGYRDTDKRAILEKKRTKRESRKSE